MMRVKELDGGQIWPVISCNPAECSDVVEIPSMTRSRWQREAGWQLPYMSYFK